MQSVGKTYYSAPAHSDVAATQSSIAQGTLETSNVNPVSSVVELISVQRYAELTQRALSLVNSGMNQTAVQDLPRISNN
jgi:flagellar basal-body rod protein FlgF/flagellar basal-body rod protein FlgG